MIEPAGRDPLVDSVRLRAARNRRYERDGDPSVARRLGQIGVLGALIVAPMLGGLFAGRWLDARFHSGLQWTAGLLVLGVALGGWSAWKWMQTS